MADLQLPQATFLDRLSEKIDQTVGAKAVFGTPIERDGTTVIPVARARWGLGGGVGTRAMKEGQGPQTGTGGGGGGVMAPLGFIEICEGRAAFRPIRDRRLLVLAGTALGVACINALGRIGQRAVMGRRVRRWTRRHMR
jgi:uncharacterized spore protein YtfJ